MVYSGGRYVNYRYNAEGSLAELDYGEGDAAPTATYRFEYDSPSTDSGDAIACNMFAYCNNNPVVFLDSTGMYSISAVTTLVSTDNDIATYTTTITSDSRYELLGFISLGSIENYKFTYVVSNTGVITFDNTQEDAKYLAKRNGGDVRLMLAAEMMRVAKEQVPGALEGRTVFGIQAELALHYTAYVLHIKRSSST